MDSEKIHQFTKIINGPKILVNWLFLRKPRRKRKFLIFASASELFDSWELRASYLIFGCNSISKISRLRRAKYLLNFQSQFSSFSHVSPMQITEFYLPISGFPNRFSIVTLVTSDSLKSIIVCITVSSRWVDRFGFSKVDFISKNTSSPKLLIRWENFKTDY